MVVSGFNGRVGPTVGLMLTVETRNRRAWSMLEVAPPDLRNVNNHAMDGVFAVPRGIKALADVDKRSYLVLWSWRGMFSFQAARSSPG